jgi:hypothetical protein
MIVFVKFVNITPNLSKQMYGKMYGKLNLKQCIFLFEFIFAF